MTRNLEFDSKLELDVYCLVRSMYSGEILLYYTPSWLNGREIDIFIPKLKVGFEINGDYWHSKHNVTKGSHFRKTQKCVSKGIKLFYLWEHEIINDFESIKKFIALRLNPKSNLIGFLNEQYDKDRKSFNRDKVSELDLRPYKLEFRISGSELLPNSKFEVYNSGRIIAKNFAIHQYPLKLDSFDRSFRASEALRYQKQKAEKEKLKSKSNELKFPYQILEQRRKELAELNKKRK